MLFFLFLINFNQNKFSFSLEFLKLYFYLRYILFFGKPRNMAIPQ